MSVYKLMQFKLTSNTYIKSGVGQGGRSKMNRYVSKESHELAKRVKILLLFIEQENYRIKEAEKPHILTCVA